MGQPFWLLPKNNIILVEGKGIEPLTHACKAHVFPLALHPLIVVWEARIELAPRVSKTRRLPLSYTQIVLVPQNGIEPLTDAYKATVIPLNYKGKFWCVG